MEPPQKRAPLGRMIPRTDDDLERMAQVDADDVEDAALWMEEHAPDAYDDLLQAPDDSEDVD